MDEQEEDASIKDRSIIPALQLRETAYQTLLSTSIANYVEYELIFSLSEAYSMQAVYKQIGGQLSEAAMNMAAYATVAGTSIDNEQFQQQFRGYFDILLAGETQLLETYATSIETLEKPR